ncbi:MAG: hypothetical protein JST92_19020 [Deltaproteobacteria bacterium]|nr:hypothetical protein [Deltaproteobacteria bacterium]
MSESDPQGARRVERRLVVLLVIAYGWLFVFFPRINNPNELVRVYMARAIAQEPTSAIGKRVQLPNGRFADTGRIIQEWGWVNDKALVCDDRARRPPECAGTLYAGKAPGPSLLAAPVVWLQERAVSLVQHRAPTKTELVFVLRWLLAILPSVFLWLWVRRFLRAHEVDAPIATVATLAGALGSMSFTFGQMLASHQLASVFLALGALAAFWPSVLDVRRALLVGVGVSGAVCMEYPSAPAAVIVAIGFLVVTRPTPKLLAISLAGTLPFALLLAHFHTVAFGAPWHTPYSTLENAGFVRDLAPGFMGISAPSFERIWGSLFAPYLGLFHWAPWTCLVLGAMLLLRERRVPSTGETSARQRAVAIVCACVVLYFILFQVNHSLWRSGWTVGPRYITPLVPFAAITVALALQRLAPAARLAGLAVLCACAIAAMIATVPSSMVTQGFPFEAYNPLREIVIPLFAHGYAARNPLQALGVPGVWSALPVLYVLLMAVLLCLASPLAEAKLLWGALENPTLVFKRVHTLMWLVLVGLLIAQWTAMKGATPEGKNGAGFLAGQWEPDPPPGATKF